MTTAYTPILQLALPVTGELNGTWGDVVNNNITSMVEQAIAGLATINTWTAASHTLTTANGTTSEARCAILQCSGAPGAAATVICPTASKVYIIKNSVTGGYAVTLKTSAGTGVSVANGVTALLYCDGTNVVSGDFNGDVVGPASATDNAVARFDLTTGKLIQNSVVTIADTTGNMAGVGTLSSGAITSSALTSGRVPYAGTAGLIQDAAAFTFDGTILSATRFAGALNGTVGATTASTGAFTTVSATGAITSTLATGTAPFTVASTTNVANLNASSLSGATFAAPGSIGSTTAGSGAFTTLSATGVTTLAAGTLGAPALTTSGDTNTGMFFPAADTIAFVEGGTEVIRINSSSNVGIGTSSPGAKLAVVGTGYSPTITITDGATLNWDTSLGQVAQVTLGGNRTFAAPTNLVNGGFYSLLIIQDGTGSRTISWNAVFDFAGGTAPTLSTAAGSKDLITWRSDGTNMLEVGRSLGVA